MRVMILCPMVAAVTDQAGILAQVATIPRALTRRMFLAVFVDQLRLAAEDCVDGIVAQVKEERTVAILVHERDGSIGESFGNAAHDPDSGHDLETHAVVGRSVPRRDAPAKVTGRAVFTEDMRLPNILYGRILTSPHAHATVRSIDTSKAEALPGVKAVLTGKDVTDTMYGISPARYDEHVLAKEKVCHVGDEVAAVAAVDEATCEKALDLIEVDYEELPAVFDPFEAMADGAPIILDRYPNNINTKVDWNFGDVEKGFEEADLVLEDTFEGNRTYQSPMEPHCATSEWDGDGHLTVYTSTQVVHYVRHQLSRVLEIPEGDVRVVGTICGGGLP